VEDNGCTRCGGTLHPRSARASPRCWTMYRPRCA
jgi:hypothetical protein